MNFITLLLTSLITITKIHPHIADDKDLLRAYANAAKFCNAIGQPLPKDEHPNAHPKTSENWNLKHYQHRYDLDYQNGPQIEVVMSTGVISFYNNSSAYNRASRSTTPAAAAISNDTALSVFDTVIKATGQSDQLGKPDIRVTQLSSPPVQAGHTISIWKSRLWQGISVLNDGATVNMQAETGEIMMMNLNYHVKIPETFSARTLQVLDERQCLMLARKFLNGRGCQETRVIEARQRTSAA
ncbi:MAG: hypothetical protein ABJA67_12450 [Chthonomonadales bacterium]